MNLLQFLRSVNVGNAAVVQVMILLKSFRGIRQSIVSPKGDVSLSVTQVIETIFHRVVFDYLRQGSALQGKRNTGDRQCH